MEAQALESQARVMSEASLVLPPPGIEGEGPVAVATDAAVIVEGRDHTRGVPLSTMVSAPNCSTFVEVTGASDEVPTAVRAGETRIFVVERNGEFVIQRVDAHLTDDANMELFATGRGPSCRLSSQSTCDGKRCVPGSCPDDRRA